MSFVLPAFNIALEGSVCGGVGKLLGSLLSLTRYTKGMEV